VMARCLQHETDHLAGKLYLDRLPPETRRAAMREIRRSPWFLGTRETPPSTPSLPSAFGGKF
jgi:peptide deformylase